MEYDKALELLEEYINTWNPDMGGPDDEAGEVLATAAYALQDCLKMGLTNPDNEDKNEYFIVG